MSWSFVEFIRKMMDLDWGLFFQINFQIIKPNMIPRPNKSDCYIKMNRMS